jgi:hypothetical protein
LDLIDQGEATYKVSGRRQLNVRLSEPAHVRGFRVGRLSDILIWDTPDRPKGFEFEVLDKSGDVLQRGLTSGRQINFLPIDRKVSRIRLRAIPAGANWPAADTRLFR